MTYLSEEDLKKTIAEHPETTFSVEKFWAQGYLEIAANRFGFEGRGLNESCPQVQPVTIEELLRTWWSAT